MSTSPHTVSRETLPPEADLGFEAFRYVAGEMADDESAAFEQRLANDQQAREAVARAVEISQAVVVLGPQAVTARRTGRRTSRRSAIVALGAALAACVVLAVALNPFGRSTTDPSDDIVVDNDRPVNAARLVAFWADAEDLLGSDSDQSNGTGLAPWLDDSAAAAENGSDSDFAWMLAAVSAELPTGERTPPGQQTEEN